MLHFGDPYAKQGDGDLSTAMGIAALESLRKHCAGQDHADSSMTSDEEPDRNPSALERADQEAKQFALGAKDWKLRLRKLESALRGFVTEHLEWTRVRQWLFETAEDPSTRRITDNGRVLCGAEEIVNMGLAFLTKPDFPPDTAKVGARIPPDAAAASSVEECFDKLRKT